MSFSSSVVPPGERLLALVTPLTTSSSAPPLFVGWRSAPEKSFPLPLDCLFKAADLVDRCFSPWVTLWGFLKTDLLRWHWCPWPSWWLAVPVASGASFCLSSNLALTRFCVCALVCVSAVTLASVLDFSVSLRKMPVAGTHLGVSVYP